MLNMATIDGFLCLFIYGRNTASGKNEHHMGICFTWNSVKSLPNKMSGQSPWETKVLTRVLANVKEHFKRLCCKCSTTNE